MEGREAWLRRGQPGASDPALAVDTFYPAAHRPSLLVALRNHLGSCKNNSSWGPTPPEVCIHWCGLGPGQQQNLLKVPQVAPVCSLH